MLNIFSNYQALTRFVRDKCDSEQELERSRVDERWLVDRLLDFLTARGGRYTFHFDTFVPAEFKTGRAGGARRIDVVGYRRSAGKKQSASMLLEAKLMMENNRQWAQEILSDIFRVASVRANTTSRTQRLVLVVGQERCWQQLDAQCDGFLRQLCDLERRYTPRSVLSAGLLKSRRRTRFTETWKSTNSAYIEDYLRAHLPTGVSIELAGLCRSKREIDEKPELGISARLWRVLPGRWNATTRVLTENIPTEHHDRSNSA